MKSKKSEIRTLEGVLRSYALGFPESTEEFPWGERAIKVRNKTFVFMRAELGEFSISVKLPKSKDLALALPFTEPTHYGLGKSGWVTAQFSVGAEPSLEMLKEWVDESYRTIAPKKLVAQLDSLTEDAGSSPQSENKGQPQRGARRPKSRLKRQSKV
jgi:predicted DNA-binding protein (MmcQ/YjbR family)